MIASAQRRLFWLALLITLLFVVITARVSHLTFRQTSSSAVRAPGVVRGPILDRRGLTLALTEEGSTIAIAPPELVDPEFTARVLSQYLEMENEEILQRLYRNQNRRYFYLQREVDNFTAYRIMDLNLPGVHREGEFQRIYPGGRLASNLLGFVGRDSDRALDGLERIYNDLLTRPESIDSRLGPALTLTIDSLIQYRLEEELTAAFEESGATRAVGIFMDIETGEILAMASLPNFDPNHYQRSGATQRGNWALRLNYEPGSTVKIFMAAMLLQEGLVRADERFLSDGEFRSGNVLIRDMRRGRATHLGNLTLHEIIEISSNVGIIKAMERLERDRFHRYMRDLGFGQRTLVFTDGSGETEGYLPGLDNWVRSTGYYMPIGQGFSVTPIQLLRAGASIANGGRLVRPHLVRQISNRHGEILDQTQPWSSPSPFTAEVNAEVMKMMRGVVERGTGSRARIADIEISGKTGSAQKASARGYTDQYIVSFLGFFPANRPRYGGLILFDGPRDGESGGTLAAPVFARVAERIQPLLDGERSIDLEPIEPMVRRETPVSEERLHNFRGLSAREALRINAIHYGLSVELVGSGYVYDQEPLPGIELSGIETLKLYLEDLH